MSPEVRAEVMARSLGRCERCRDRQPGEVHHRVTRARGGPDDPDNLAALCKACHDHAHAENEWPWLVPGYFLRGVYVGPDETYRRRWPSAS